MIKQFVVTNCSKKRPGSKVTKTLKNGILIPIATSKESHFNADFKYITHQKSSQNLPVKSYDPENIRIILDNRGKATPKSHRILTKIITSDSAYPRTLL